MRIIISGTVAAWVGLWGGAGPAGAADRLGDFVSHGPSCADYLRHRTGHDASAEAAAYVLGFVTAYNSYVKNDKTDVLGVLTRQRGILYEAVAEVCKDAPDESLGYALGRFLEDWDKNNP